MSNEGLDIDNLKEKADTLFSASKDISTLKEYLDQVTGEDVSMANFTPAQTGALAKIMGLDNMYLEPCEDIDEKENNCKQIVKIVVKLSKGKSGYGLDKLESMLRAKMGMDQDSSVLRSDKEVNEDEKDED